MSAVINTNIASVIAQRSLANTSVQMSTALQRLSTGQCDPAGGAQPAAWFLTRRFPTPKAPRISSGRFALGLT